MAPGPPNLQSNSFALLAEGPPKKRKNNNNKLTTTNPFPTLPATHSPDHKYIVVSAINSDKKLAQYSCFAVYKSLLIISKEIISVSELRDGNLLLLVKNSTVAAKFIASKSLPGICEIEAKYHGNLNLTKGTVYAPFLNYISDEEIVEELKEVGVVNAYKFQKNIDGKMQPSGVILLSFDRFNLPSSIDIAWRKVDVRQYFPNPMRCRNCQLLGHTAKYCNRPPACVNCNLPPHSPNNCIRSFCANCFGDHPASSNTCPKYQQSKEILKIKTENKCTLGEAVKKYKQINPTPVATHSSYAAAAAAAPLSVLPNNPPRLLPPTTTLHSTSSSISPTLEKTTSRFNNNTPSQSSYKPTPSLSSTPNSPLNTVNDLDRSSPPVFDDSNIFSPLPSLNKVVSLSKLSDMTDSD